jgi:heme a synthase
VGSLLQRYKEYPEFKENIEISLDEFKEKYWIEHAHRVYGRLLGLYITLPSAFFLLFKWLDKPMRKRIYLINTSVILQVK